MRIIISFIAASMFAAGSALAEPASAEPAKTETSATPATRDNSAEAVKPAAAQTVAVKPRESGPDQPLCTGE